MRIIYLSSVCSQSKFDKCVSEGKIKKMPQAQKYHRLLVEGLQKVADTPITVISSYPVVSGKKRAYATERECVKGVTFIYPGFLLFPFVRQLCLFVNTVKILLSLVSKDSVIVCDVLNGSVCLAARFVRLICKTKIVGIVTDVPGLTSGARLKTLSYGKRLISKCASLFIKRTLKKYDGYLLLTEAMNEVVNMNNRPYIVIEGHSDLSLESVVNTVENKNPVKNIMYAGGIHKEFGIGLLVDSFLELDNKEWELHIYGDGNYQNELMKISREHRNIKYFGMKPNYEIVNEQIKSWIMVNPRITNAEYVKYSFPSKTLECMGSGTPLLTTKLAGMPKEYYKYVYLFDDETKEGFKNSLSKVLSKSAEELNSFGLIAKNFAIKNKNNVKQAERFYLFLKNNF